MQALPAPPKAEVNPPTWQFTGNVAVLSEPHDVRQLWLPFPIVYRSQALPRPAPPRASNAVPPKKLNRKIAYEPWPQFLLLERGVDQFVLPFPEWQHCRDGLVKRLFEYDFPAFDRGFDGEPLGGWTQWEHQKVLEWCRENCTGRYLTKDESRQKRVIFEKRRDHTKARLSGLFD